jgi:Uncharacterized protein conserved in bacteria
MQAYLRNNAPAAMRHAPFPIPHSLFPVLISCLLCGVSAAFGQTQQFVLDPQSATERVYKDLSFAPPKDATSVVLSFQTPAPHIAQGATIHLKSSPLTWMQAKPQIVNRGANGFDIICRKNFVNAESGAAATWDGCDAIRISFWRQIPERTIDATLASIKYETDSVAVCMANSATAPGAEWIAGMFVDRIFKTFAGMSVGAAAVTSAEIAAGLPENIKLLVIPFASEIPPAMLAGISKFMKTGGKVVTYYTNSHGLAVRLNMRQTQYRGFSGDKFKMRMLPVAENMEPIYAPTWGVVAATAEAEDYAAAYWQDAGGLIDKSAPACSVTAKGAWFSHAPPMATPASIAFLEHIVFDRLKLEIPRGERVFGKTPPKPAPRPGLLGLWFHHPGSGYGSWEKVAAEYAEAGVTDFFVNLQSGGTLFFHDPKFPGNSKNVPPRRADNIDALLAAGAKHKLKLHAWTTCFTVFEHDEALVKKLREKDRLMRRSSGEQIPWLCPSSKENVALVLDGIQRLAAKGFQGVHLDFIRYADPDTCYCDTTKAAFIRATKLSKVKWPQDVLPDGKHRQQFMDFRAAEITSFVAQAKKIVKKANLNCTLSAAVFPDPNPDYLGQRWSGWLQDKLIDYAMPMVYSETATGFAEYLRRLKAGVPDSAKIIPGIGYSADESLLDAAGLAEQAAIAAELFPQTGIVIFSGDPHPLNDIKKAFRPKDSE